MKQTQNASFYVALGIRENDPGFSIVSTSLTSLGNAKRIGKAFWELTTASNLEETFRVLNTSMLHRRIDSSAALILLDPISGKAKWHLRQPLSDLIRAQWSYQHNLLISCDLQGPGSTEHPFYENITRLGTWTPISKSLWYVSSPYTLVAAMQFLAGVMKPGDSLALLNNDGEVVSWKAGKKQQQPIVKEAAKQEIAANRDKFRGKRLSRQRATKSRLSYF